MSESILNIEVSCFKNYQSKESCSINLLKWLTSLKYQKEVDAIRTLATKNEKDKLKALLPAITPSGQFKERNANGLIKHSGFISIDIDFKDNTHIENYSDLKTELKKIKQIAYIGLSVSGNGYWCLIPIQNTSLHKESIVFIGKQLKNYGINIDMNCTDICRLRGYSYDLDAYFNHSAIPLLLPKNCTTISTTHYKTKSFANSTSDFERLIFLLQNKNIDITYNYQDWLSIGFALASEFGESGRNYFHTISALSPKYDFEQCETKYTKIVQYNRAKISISTIFYKCKEFGIDLKKLG